MKTNDFKKGYRVKYTPNYGDPEYGVVSSTNHRYVFVKYDNADCVMTTGDEPYTAQATLPNWLTII